VKEEALHPPRRRLPSVIGALTDRAECIHFAEKREFCSLPQNNGLATVAQSHPCISVEGIAECLHRSTGCYLERLLLGSAVLDSGARILLDGMENYRENSIPWR